MRTPNPVRIGDIACERFGRDILGARVETTPVRAEMLRGIAGRRAEEYDVRRRSRVADSSRGFSHVTLMRLGREIRAAGAGAKRAAR